MIRRTSRGPAAGVLVLAVLVPALLHAETVTSCDSFPRQTLRDFTLSVPPYDWHPATMPNTKVVLDIVVDGKFLGENTGNCAPAGCAE